MNTVSLYIIRSPFYVYQNLKGGQRNKENKKKRKIKYRVYKCSSPTFHTTLINTCPPIRKTSASTSFVFCLVNATAIAYRRHKNKTKEICLAMCGCVLETDPFLRALFALSTLTGFAPEISRLEEELARKLVREDVRLRNRAGRIQSNIKKNEKGEHRKNNTKRERGISTKEDA